ncbi:hypothetical protein KUC66_22385, partial [Pseudomonas aeruginosa]|uniref:hypothetical protein n=1 Tax=Pseudomonas aeruginosa TaxID=287 RepID=UPI0021E142A2
RSAAQADIGTMLGNAMPVGAFGIGSERPDRAPSIHRYATSVENSIRQLLTPWQLALATDLC